MSKMKKALQHMAREFPETRSVLLPVLRRHAGCGCGDEALAGDLDEMLEGRLAGDLDEMLAGRQFRPGDPKTNGEYAKGVKDKGKWIGDNKGKGKCYYETGDEADRCYVTTNGGPGGQKKPKTGPAGKPGSPEREEYNRKYVQQRWNKGAAERLAELREARVSKRESMRRMNDLEKEHGKGSKAYFAAVIAEVKSGDITPSAVVGGGYKNGKKVALKWLEDQMKDATKQASSETWGRRLSLAKAAFLDEIIKQAKDTFEHNGESARVSRHGVTAVLDGSWQGQPVSIRWQWAPRGGIGDLQFEISWKGQAKKDVLKIISLDPGSVASQTMFAHFKGVLP